MRRRATLLKAVLVILVSSTLSTYCWAGPWSGSKIGVIDMRKVLEKSQAATEMRSILLKDIEVKKGVLYSREQSVHAMEKALKEFEAKQGDPTEVAKKKEDIARAITELKQLRDDMEDALKKKEKELKQTLYNQVKKVTKAFLKQKEYAIVLEKKAVIAYDDAVDITDAFIDMFDQQKEQLRIGK